MTVEGAARVTTAFCCLTAWVCVYFFCLFLVQVIDSDGPKGICMHCCNAVITLASHSCLLPPSHLCWQLCPECIS